MLPKQKAAMPVTSLHPKKLLLSKWTAVAPARKEKHFLVSRVILPDPPDAKIEWVELEAVHTKKTLRLKWRALRDPANWLQGWL